MSCQIVATIGQLPKLHGVDGLCVYVKSVESPWRYVGSGAEFTIDHITVEATLNGGDTRWVRETSYASPIWSALGFVYIDGTNGNDENLGFYATAQASPAPIKTHAEFTRRVGRVWDVAQSRSVQYRATYPSDPLSLEIRWRMPTTGPAPLVTFSPPPFTQFHTGTFSAVTARDNASNTPFDVADGTVDTTGDVQRRIRITSGARAGSVTWVAKSTGVGRRRTGEWGSFPTPDSSFTPIVPQVGDPYVIEAAASQLVLDHITITKGPGASFANGMPQVFFTNIDFRPPENDAVPSITNGGGGIAFEQCQFQGGEWVVFSEFVEGDNTAGFTYFGNCSVGGPATGGIGNLHFRAGTWTDNLIDAGVFFGNVGVWGGGGVTIDFNTLCQGSFAIPAAVGGGQLNIGQVGVMDWASSVGGVIIGDAVAGLSFGRDSGLPGWIWGTTGSPGAWGVDVRDGGTLRYANGSMLTITGPGGDVRIAGSTSARAWDETLGAYTPSIALSWPVLMNGALLNNAHNVAHDAHVYKNSGAAEP